ncbi:MAG: flagellar basal body P-ring protein FlgI [Gemmatimonadaceae bacterium]|nr:flagellar basal body P-ring protein FlgI [Gemmatimonadaceae bacterium]
MTVRRRTRRRTDRSALRVVAACALLSLALLTTASVMHGQSRIRDLVLADGAAPVRMVGYGLVAGLDGTGDRGAGGSQGGQTVQSIVNLLRRFDITVPANVLRTRNVAAVLVTAEVSAYLRPGGHFDVQVSSIGDAPSLRGGVLYMTPLISEVGGTPMATAQGGVVLSEGSSGGSRSYGMRVETSARVPGGGIIEAELPRAAYGTGTTALALREPDIAVASRIAAVIDSALGAGTARVDDPGSVTLTLKDTAGSARSAALSKLRELPVRVTRGARVVIDGRDGTVVAGGDVSVGEAVVTHGQLTLTIGGGSDSTKVEAGEVRLQPGTSVQRIASALHGVRSSPQEIAAIFSALREVGALAAEIVIR